MYTFIDKLLLGSFQTTAKISRVGHVPMSTLIIFRVDACPPPPPVPAPMGLVTNRTHINTNTSSTTECVMHLKVEMRRHDKNYDKSCLPLR